MNIQIFGIKKCQDTRKAERYFKERKIKYQFIDLAVKGLSKGELNSVKTAVGLENLIDKTSKEYKNSNLQYIIHNIEDVLLTNPLLFRTPIVRNGQKSTIGYHPDIWKQWD
jgi:arsenate reductase-like glutaredoxin family protein